MVLKKDNLKVIITASHNFSIPTLILINLLKKNKIKISGIIILSLFERKRIKRYIYNKSINYFITNFKNSILNKFNSNRNFISKLQSYKKQFCPSSPNIINWCRKNNIKYTLVRNINSKKTLDFLANDNKQSIVIYSGGGILKNKFLKSAFKVINSHAGPLPEVRGMNAAEWSALLGLRPEITLHYIDSGIDTGQIIKAYPYDRSKCLDINDLRETAVITGIEAIIDFLLKDIFNLQSPNNNIKSELLDPKDRQFFSMSPLLQELTNKKLKSQAYEKHFN